MNKTNQVASFVEEIFDLYDLDKLGFFFELDEDAGERYEIPLFITGEIDNETMARLSTKLGLTTDEILSLDKKVMYKYWDKYAFFKLYYLFLEEWRVNSRYKERKQTAENLLEAIFSNEETLKLEERYDYKSVTQRMLQQLKEMDEFLPGTFHADAKVTNLEINTEVLFSFPEITEMLHSYITLIKKVKEYFFKAIKEQLTEEEIHEYNFLVNALQIVDSIMPSSLLTYDHISTYRHAYIEEGFEDFFSYAKVVGFVGTGGFLHPGVDPWRCKEFFDDMTLVQELACIFPFIKEQIQDFSMKVKNFRCFFVWSDAEAIKSTPEEDEFDKYLGTYIPPEQRKKEPTLVYVAKTAEEMFDWAPHIEKMNRLISPSTKGGIAVRPIAVECIPPHSAHRLIRRLESRSGGNV